MSRNRHGNPINKLLARAFPNGAPKERITADEKTSSRVHDVILRTTPIFWGVPCDEVSFSRFWIRYEQHANKMPWDGFAGSEGTYLAKARNIIHNAYLESSLANTHLMMLDSDILFPSNIADTLLKWNLPIVGGWYKDKNAPDHHPAVYNFVSEDKKGVASWTHRKYPGEGLEKVDATGAGCWLMSRKVAEMLGKDPYSLDQGGEDMKLCRMLMKLNIPLYVDWSINCAHLGVGYV